MLITNKAETITINNFIGCLIDVTKCRMTHEITKIIRIEVNFAVFGDVVNPLSVRKESSLPVKSETNVPTWFKTC